MRIISGTIKGHKIAAPKGDHVRPTTDRVRESVFNILQDFPLEAKVLDLFAGSGAMGIEALSRGAKETVFVDSSSAAIKAIKNNLEITGLATAAKVYKCEVADYFIRYKEAEEKFNLIFLDPPYKISTAELERVFNNLPFFLADNGLVVLELGSKLPCEPGDSLRLMDSRRYGDTYIYIFK